MANKKSGSDNLNPDSNNNLKSGARRRRNLDRSNPNDYQLPEPPTPTRSGPRWPDSTQNITNPEQLNSNQPENGKNAKYQPLRDNSRSSGPQPPRSQPLPPKSRWNANYSAKYEELNSDRPNVPLRPNAVQMRPKSQPVKRKSNLGRFVLYFFLFVFVLAGLAGLYIYTRLSNFTSGISVQRVDTNNNPVSGSSFNGHDSVNIVLLGLDTRPGNPDGTRSDTIIVVRINPQTKAASMLSIPRDLWVDIPGNGKNRINSAYTFGDMVHPGTGGPPLVEATIEKNFGLHIDYFAQVDFEDFEQVIDAIGGVTIDVPKPLIDAQFPTLDYGLRRIYIPAGIQHMNGQTAVAYARSRHADSDTGRNQRQQQVLTAIREQGVGLSFLNNTKLQQSLQRAIKTDLQMGDILSLAQLAIGLNKSNIHNFAIDFNLAVPTDIDAGNVLMPQWDGIHTLVTQFQNSTNTAQAEIPSSTPTVAPAHIKVLNGTFVEGRAATTQKFLESKGFTVVGVGQASDAGNYPSTIIKVYNNRQDAANAIATSLGISSNNVHNGDKGPPGVDIEVICGNDLQLPATK